MQPSSDVVICCLIYVKHLRIFANQIQSIFIFLVNKTNDPSRRHLKHYSLNYSDWNLPSPIISNKVWSDRTQPNWVFCFHVGILCQLHLTLNSKQSKIFYTDFKKPTFAVKANFIQLDWFTFFVVFSSVKQCWACYCEAAPQHAAAHHQRLFHRTPCSTLSLVWLTEISDEAASHQLPASSSSVRALCTCLTEWCQQHWSDFQRSTVAQITQSVLSDE